MLFSKSCKKQEQLNWFFGGNFKLKKTYAVDRVNDRRIRNFVTETKHLINKLYRAAHSTANRLFTCNDQRQWKQTVGNKTILSLSTMCFYCI